MAESRTFDVVVLGAGPVGENAADRAARTGLSVAVVEGELVGGECSYWACMPSKTLLRPGAVLAAANAAPGASAIGRVDVAAVLARRDAVVSHWDDGSQVEWLEGAGLTLVRGHGRLAGPRTVTVDDGTTLTARHAVVVATGSEPVIPPIPGLADVAYWTSREATGVHEVPGSVAIVGGGVVACEMATALADLGSSVTVLARGARLLAGFEPAAGEEVARGLAEIGVDVRLGVPVVAVAADGDGARVTLEDGGQVRVDEVLVATGRRPRTGDVGLASVGLEPGEPLAVDDEGRVTAVDGGWLYATGDVTGRTATTHQGKYDARVTGDAIARRFGGEPADVDGAGDWSRYRATADRAAVPQVVFTRPEVAAVGLTEAAARSAGLDVRAVTVPFSVVAGTTVTGVHHGGYASLVVDREREVVVGATFVGPEIAELLHAATIAVAGEVPLARLWHAVPAYPTRSEVWLRLLEAYGL